MKDTGQKILEYLYRQKIDNGIRRASITELPNTSGVNYLARSGYVVAIQKSSSSLMQVEITGKGIDWVKNNAMSDRQKLLKHYYIHRSERSIFTSELGITLNIDQASLISEARYLTEKGLLEKVGKGTLNGDMFLRITAFGIDEIEQESAPLALDVRNAIHGIKSSPTVVIEKDIIKIKIRDEIYSHLKRGKYLENEDYFHAVDEAYKVVRKKLEDMTGEEAATDVFNMNAENKKYYQQLFGKLDGSSKPEKDFYRGVGYLHLGVQFLRNEKAHSLATTIDPNIAIHYISLASLAYDLISRCSTQVEES